MNVPVLERQRTEAARLAIVDCDIHPSPRSMADIKPYLSERWRRHMDAYGNNSREPLQDTLTYPRIAREVSREDAWPPGGGPPGSDLDFMRRQHLDPNGVETGILVPLRTRAYDQRNLDYAAALCTAVNDWQLADWIEREPRLRGSMVVPQDDPTAAVAEIERRAADRRFVQILLPPRTPEPLGRRRYWPVFEAAERAGLPLALHVGGVSGHPCTASGWASFYFEEHHSNIQTMETLVTSMVLEGVFERFPDLRLVLIESGFAWVPALGWRLDKYFERMRDEVPHLRMRPSEYIRRNVYYTTQPIDEPERARDIKQVIDWVGIERIMFSTDYPHWDFDDPRYALNAGGALTAAERTRIFTDNARALYRLETA